MWPTPKHAHPLAAGWYDIAVGRGGGGGATAPRPRPAPSGGRDVFGNISRPQSDGHGGYSYGGKYHPGPNPIGAWYDIVGARTRQTARATPAFAVTPSAPQVGGWPHYGGHAHALVGQSLQVAIPGPQPSAYLTELAPPDSVKRFILPMSTGVPILPTQSAQITGRPQGVCYVVERCLFSNAGTPGGAADWICNDIKIGNQSQFIQSGDVPGDMFATNAIDTYVSFQPAQTAMDVVLVVTYIGSNESGAPFYASMLGRVAI